MKFLLSKYYDNWTYKLYELKEQNKRWYYKCYSLIFIYYYLFIIIYDDCLQLIGS